MPRYYEQAYITVQYPLKRSILTHMTIVMKSIIEGRFTEEGFPCIPVSIGERIVSCIIDTGFGGDIALPTELAAQLGVIPTSTVQIELADGNRRLMYVATEPVRIGDVEFSAEILVGVAEPLIGMGLLRHFKVVLDARAGLVRLEPHERTS